MNEMLVSNRNFKLSYNTKHSTKSWHISKNVTTYLSFTPNFSILWQFSRYLSKKFKNSEMQFVVLFQHYYNFVVFFVALLLCFFHNIFSNLTHYFHMLIINNFLLFYFVVCFMVIYLFVDFSNITFLSIRNDFFSKANILCEIWLKTISGFQVFPYVCLEFSKILLKNCEKQCVFLSSLLLRNFGNCFRYVVAVVQNIVSKFKLSLQASQKTFSENVLLPSYQTWINTTV